MYKQEEYTIESPDMNGTFITDLSPEYMALSDGTLALSLANLSDIMLAPVLEDLSTIPSPSILQDDTMDVALVAKYQNTNEFIPVTPQGPPVRVSFPGSLDFQVEISASDTHKNKYLYSSQLNRIYVDMKINFPVHFRWDQNLAPRPMFVRATVVFSDESQGEKRVERCTQHTHESNQADVSQTIVKNVLRSSREMGTHGVYYCGLPEVADSWYSVLVQLSTPTTHAYQFVCKNSCSSGINRRAIDIIFTLENANGQVYGRQTVGARVCSCPKRDINRDEDETKAKGGKKRMSISAANPEQRSKKVKAEVVHGDKTLVTLPPIRVVGTRPVIAGFEVMINMLEFALSLKMNDAKATEEYAASIAALRSEIDKLKKPPQ